MLSIDGWINGFSALTILIIGLLFGFFLIYKSIKTNAKLLGIMGVSMLFLGLVYLGLTTEFIVVLLTGVNLENSEGIIGRLGYMWVAFAVIPAIYIGLELIFPKKNGIY